jgi:hypothetical protein
MRLKWRRSSQVQDRFETWIKDCHQRLVLEGETTPIEPCPDDSFLRDLSHKSRRVRLLDPRVEHAANCPICMSRLLTIRGENRSRSQRLAFFATAFACLLVLALAVFIRHERRFPKGNGPAISQTINLWDANTTRGQQPGSFQSVSIPASIVRLTVILPRFSTPGQYQVVVTRDRSGSGVVARGIAPAVNEGDREIVSVKLDLRQVPRGTYLLATIHEQDRVLYYYPLRIR